MNLSFPPLLITSCIQPSAPLTALSNPSERLTKTVKAIGIWLNQYPGIQLIICDGSGFNFTPILQSEFPNKKIECLFFKNNEIAVSNYGKGYGEGEIVNYALEHSQILKSSNHFAKVTSKLWVKNLDEYLQSWDRRFLISPQFKLSEKRNNVTLETVDTRFYIAEKSFYLEHLANAHLSVRDLEGYYLEHSFKDCLLKGGIKKFGAASPIVIEGTSGSSGKDYYPLFDSRALLKEAVELLCAKKTTDFIFNATHQKSKKSLGEVFFLLHVQTRYCLHKIFYGVLKPAIQSILTKTW
jgi:hypothetical protein